MKKKQFVLCPTFSPSFSSCQNNLKFRMLTNQRDGDDTLLVRKKVYNFIIKIVRLGAFPLKIN